MSDLRAARLKHTENFQCYFFLDRGTVSGIGDFSRNEDQGLGAAPPEMIQQLYMFPDLGYTVCASYNYYTSSGG